MSRTDYEIRQLDQAHERGMGDRVPKTVGITMGEMQRRTWERLIELMDVEPVSVLRVDLDELLEIPCDIQPCTAGCEPDEFSIREMLERLR